MPPGRQSPVVRRARNLFLQDYPFETIYVLTGLPYSVYFRKQNRWKKLKDVLDEQILKEIRQEAISEKAEKFVFKGLDLALKYIDRISRKGYEMDIRDFKLIMDSVQAVHRIKQLETGQATDISRSYDSMSPEEVKQYLQDLKQEIITSHGEMLNYTDITPEQALAQISGEDGEH